MVNKSNSQERRASIYECLDKCDGIKPRESILIDKIIELEDSLFELQQAYIELTLSFRRRCVHVPF